MGFRNDQRLYIDRTTSIHGVVRVLGIAQCALEYLLQESGSTMGLEP
jgi:hypothetical protein